MTLYATLRIVLEIVYRIVRAFIGSRYAVNRFVEADDDSYWQSANVNSGVLPDDTD